jgi:hypothetical protein
MIGGSIGARAMQMTGGLAKRVTHHAQGLADVAVRQGRRFDAGAGFATSAARSRAYGVASDVSQRVARGAQYAARHPRGTMGVGAGLGAGAVGYGASKRRGSQNYPMY